MLLSEHIANLQKALKEKGDQELFTWVDTPDDTLYISKLKNINIEEIDGNEFQIPHDLRNQNGNIIIMTSLDLNNYDEDQDSIQDMTLEVLEDE